VTLNTVISFECVLVLVNINLQTKSELHQFKGMTELQNLKMGHVTRTTPKVNARYRLPVYKIWWLYRQQFPRYDLAYKIYKKLCYRRGTTRRIMSLEILTTAAHGSGQRKIALKGLQ